MVYGAPLTIPGDFISSPPEVDLAGHLRQLRDRVGVLAPVLTALHGQLHRQTLVLASLARTPFVFVCRDGKKKPLQTPYTGPYRVLMRGDKTFIIDYGGREETVSIDHLKPAHTDSEAPVQVARPPRRGGPLNRVQMYGNRRVANSFQEPFYSRHFVGQKSDWRQKEKLHSFGRCRQDNATFSPHFHRDRRGTVLSASAMILLAVARF